MRPLLIVKHKALGIFVGFNEGVQLWSNALQAEGPAWCIGFLNRGEIDTHFHAMGYSIPLNRGWFEIIPVETKLDFTEAVWMHEACAAADVRPWNFATWGEA